MNKMVALIYFIINDDTDKVNELAVKWAEHNSIKPLLDKFDPSRLAPDA